MKSISLLVLKKRWFLFLILLIMVFMTNLVFWNESTQLFRNFSSMERMRIEGEKGSYESYYIPVADENNFVAPMSLTERQKIYQAFSAFMDGNQKMYANKLSFIAHGEELRLVSQDELKDALLGEELEDYLFNDLLLPKGEKTEKLFHDLNAIGSSIGLRTMFSSYQINKDYFLNNFYFALGFSALILLFSFFVFQSLVKASMKICQNELRVLRVVGVGKRRLVKNYLCLFFLPVVLGVLVFILLVYTSSGTFIWTDFLSLSCINGLFYLSLFINVNRNMKEVFYD
ncbi:hypothetical protein [Streptococcus oriscaviae]|uniref:ABC transporter permease n=1 Tax=Streptococcus oriscaviae TaxID=2781599 RepID=A0ABX7YI58_9STRE|nr:hypothetical protein [Streptococcus oriscaviae]QUE53375.1 hypothetical protein INT76_05675 [Streptococcus oriscaviae]